MATNFMNPGIIADSVATPQPINPLATAESVARVRQLQEQTALAPVRAQQAQANVQETQLGNQQRQQEIDDQKAFGEALKTVGPDPDKLEAATASITSPRVQSQLQNVISQMRARQANTTASQEKMAAAIAGQAYSQVQAVRDAQDPKVKSGLWGNTVQWATTTKDANGNPLVPPGVFDPNTVPDENTLETLGTILDKTGAFHKSEADRLETKAKTQKAQTEADQAAYSAAVQSMPTDHTDPDIQAKWTAWRSSLPASKQISVPAQFSPAAVADVRLAQVPTKDQPEYLIKRRQADASQNMTPESIQQGIATVINPAEHPQEFKDTLNRALLSLKGGTLTQNVLDAYVKDTSDRLAQEGARISEETDPRLISARIGQAVATQKALRQGSNPDLANVAPDLVSKVTGDATKLDNDYAKAKNATESLGKLLDLADQGNAVAGASVAGTGVGILNAINGIKRINPKSVEDYGNAGSVLQELQGKLDKWGGKGPIPGSLRDEIRELHQDLGQQSYKTYTDNLNSINARSGASLKPTLGPPNIAKSAQRPAQGGYKIGGTYGNHKYLGGDPNQPTSWQQ